MKYDFVVIGATGMQGKIASKDLLESGYSVLLCGRNKASIIHLLKKYKRAGFAYADLRDVEEASHVIKKSRADVVLNCAEGDWNMNALSACILAGANYLDLGSDIKMTKEQLAMHSVLKKKKLIAITGCGSIPGTANVMMRHAAEKLDRIKSSNSGFAWNANMEKFVVPFSIQSVTEELEGPSPVIKKGKIKWMDPMKNSGVIKTAEIGTQRCFLIQHSEVYTFYHYFKSKGLENVSVYGCFPDYSLDMILHMIELGLTSKEPIMVDGNSIKPIDFLTDVLKNLKRPDGYREKENIWTIAEGSKDGKKRTIKMECIVPTLKGWEDAGCNIDTGMPASIMAQMIKKGMIKSRGCFSPEAVVPPEPFFKELRKRKMIVKENGRVIN